MKDLALLGIFAPILLFFQQFKGIIVSILGFFWKARQIPYTCSYQFYKKVHQESLKLELNNWQTGHFWAYIKGGNSDSVVLYKKYPYQVFLYKKFIPIIIRANKLGYNDRISVSYFNFTFPFEDFLRKASTLSINSWNRSNFAIEIKQGKSLKNTGSGGVNITNTIPSSSSGQSSEELEILNVPTLTANSLASLITHSQDEVMPVKERNPKDKYTFTEQGRSVHKVVEKWIEAKNFYDSRNITYKYSILLSGKPGSGKSSLIREIAKDFQLRLYVFDLSTMDNQEFKEHLENLVYGPAIILFEDIDTIYNGRENISKTEISTGLTFDFFINALSGVNQIKNKLIFVTSNHIEKLDPALLRRFDKKFDFVSMTLEEKESYLGKLTDNKEIIKELLIEGVNDSNAEFEQRSIEKVLGEYWSEKL